MMRLSRLALRGVATVLVLFGVGCTKKPVNDGPANTSPGPEVVPVGSPDGGDLPLDLGSTVSSSLPASVDEKVVRSWLEHQRPTSSWVLFKKQAVKAEMEGASLSASISPGWIADSPLGKLATSRGQVPVADAVAALDKAEAEGLYDHWLAAYLWRRTTSPSASFYARLEEHARVTDALLLARGQVKPPTISPRAWASKAGPSHAQRIAWETFVKDVLKTAHDEYPRTEPGTWKRDGRAVFSPVPSSPAPSIVHGGKLSPLTAGTRFGRLDLLVTSKEGKSSIEHDWLGRIELPSSTTISVWSLEGHLSPTAKKKIGETIKAALDGDDKAALQLERAMPLVHRALRTALGEAASAKGAPRLRTILALFDDVPMSPPVDPMPNDD